MSTDKAETQRVGLERLCKPTALSKDHITIARFFPGLERVDAFFRNRGYAPHRHDTYGIGITTHGVQSFEYRGQTRHSVARQLYVLHPDELHDGRPGAKGGYGYQTLYLDPKLVHQALNGQELPFVQSPVTDDPQLRRAVHSILAHPILAHPIPANREQAIDDLTGTGLVLALSDALARLSQSRKKPVRIDAVAVATARDLLISRACDVINSVDLEDATGHDRWSLSRQFRAAYGVSPHRFQTLRRLDCVRALIDDGVSLVDAAQRTGFADQSHLSRHFRNAYGVPPGIWRSLTGNWARA
ncbi:MAG: AraC family transcriptional regulator [Alphaproteobacteria bacterium]|nr:AraC family transcriptional regulator [Alphaproteobacteria bacterium]